MDRSELTILRLGNARNIRDCLKEEGFPLGKIVRSPVSAIEGMATLAEGGTLRGVCARSCIGCSAAAIHPRKAKRRTALLTPRLLEAILDMARDLAATGAEIISSVRLNLFSGSNELEHPHCLALRRLMSHYFRDLHGIPLGGISSDVIFHVAPSRVFRNNLTGLLNNSLLFDNICIALDEQMPFADQRAYDEYLAALAWVWQSLHGALRMDLDRFSSGGRKEPRVILNFLLPPSGSAFLPSVRNLYPGGPLRATTYKELQRRYVEPFVGRLLETGASIPGHHVFTTSVGSLAGIPGSLVFVSEASFEPVGRARLIINNPASYQGPRMPQVRTKIYPVGRSAFTFRAELALNRFSDGDIGWSADTKPEWVHRLSTFEFLISAPPESHSTLEVGGPSELNAKCG